MKYYDFHSHILPGMDDGAENEEISSRMLISLKEQGVEYVMLTPHFLIEFEGTNEFVIRRDKALHRLKSVYDEKTMPKIGMGAEVALRRGLSKIDCKALGFLDGYILLELPDVYGDWIIDEIENLMVRGFKPIFAHIERPFINYQRRQFERLIDYKSFIYQMNVSALSSRTLRNYFIKHYLEGANFILGSDAHNMKGRRPDFDSKALSHRKLLSSGFIDAVTQNSKYILSKAGNLYGEL